MSRIKSEVVRRKLTIMEAATYCGVTDRTVRTWIASGILPASRFGPRVVRIDLDDLESLGKRIQAAG